MDLGDFLEALSAEIWRPVGRTSLLREDEFNLDVLSFRWLLDIPVELLPRQLQCADLELEGCLGRRQRYGSRCWDNI